jgi:parallel beta helix pectate lyase-like protein
MLKPVQQVTAGALMTIAFSGIGLAVTAQRTFVSTAGSDANTTSLCSRQMPCRGFAAAISVTNAGGEVVALDSGGYGAVEITQSVQIVAPLGVHAAIATTTGIPIPSFPGLTADVVVNAPGAVVTLRNIALTQQGTVAIGIVAEAVGSLHVEGCAITGFENGLYFGVPGNLIVRDSIARHNGVSIYIFAPPGEVAKASIDSCRLEGNISYGISVSSRAQATVSDTVATGPGGTGFYVSGAGGTPAQLNCDRCVASNLATGFVSEGAVNVVMRVGRSTATNNGSGFVNLGATFKVLTGTNMVDGNSTNTAGIMTPLAGI